jgi:hypothetical protein
MTANAGTSNSAILDSMQALRGLARIMHADAPEITSLTQRIDTLAKDDPQQAGKLRAILLHLTGDHEGALAHMRAQDSHDPAAEMNILVDAGKCDDAQRLFMQHGHPKDGSFPLMLKYGYGCGAFRQMANFAREAQHMKLANQDAVEFDQIFNIDSLLSRLQIDDQATAGVLAVAGQVMVEHRLRFLGEQPSIDVFDIPDVLHALHLTYHLPTTPEHAAAMSVQFVERLVEQDIVVPNGLHVSFSGRDHAG